MEDEQDRPKPDTALGDFEEVQAPSIDVSGTGFVGLVG
jgi:hypothetical protein